jgi:hypothetical protein
MEPKKISFEDLKNLKCGDEIVTNDPFTQQETPYVLMSIEDKSFYFISEIGASLNITSQDTIDGFNVKLIDETHPKWNDVLSNHGKELATMLDSFLEKDFEKHLTTDIQTMMNSVTDIDFK